MSTPSFKLYYTPTSCGAASYIAAHVSGVAFDSEQVNIRSKLTASGADFRSINPKGNVPAVVIGSGPSAVLLNEGAATLQFIADQNPASKLAPANGTLERYQLQNYLNFLASELHASYGPLFNPALSAECKEAALAKLKTKLDYVEANFVNNKFLLGDNFTVADSYLYIILSWSPYVGVSLEAYPKIQKYFDGIKALPQVQEAHKKMAEQPAAPQ